jgi:hypothetical protein
LSEQQKRTTLGRRHDPIVFINLQEFKTRLDLKHLSHFVAPLRKYKTKTWAGENSNYLDPSQLAAVAARECRSSTFRRVTQILVIIVQVGAWVESLAHANPSQWLLTRSSELKLERVNSFNESCIARAFCRVSCPQSNRTP